MTSMSQATSSAIAEKPFRSDEIHSYIHSTSFAIPCHSFSQTKHTHATQHTNKAIDRQTSHNTNTMSFFDKMKKASKSVVDAGAKTMLKVSDMICCGCL
jgi:hypothetical protein